MKIKKFIKQTLSLGLCTLMVAGPLSGCQTAKDAEDKKIRTMVENMTLEQKVGQMMIASFRIWQDLSIVPAEGEEPEKIPVTELNDEIKACVQRNHFGGSLLFAENIKDPEQTFRLVRQLQAHNQKGGNQIPLFIAADQEGGSVSRIGFGTTGVGNMALAATGNPENAKTMAAIHAEELMKLGINVDFAPVMDVNNNPKNPVIGVRSFSDDPETVAKFGQAYINGLNSKGCIATLKHFPGHGDTDSDSHTGLPLVDKSLEELKSFELLPFQNAIDQGVDMIMTAHIQYPQIEKETYVSVSTGEEVYLPATMSKAILTDLLRTDMGFEGVVVTDALDMQAITNHFAFEDVIAKSINAGADMLILPIVTNTDIFAQTDGVVALTVGMVNDGTISEERINESVIRILKLKKKYKILDISDFSFLNSDVDKICEYYEGPANRGQADMIAMDALTLLKNEKNAYPIGQKAGDKTLILFADSCASRIGYGELVKRELENGQNITVMKNDAENAEACIQAAMDADHVILVSRAYNEACLDPASGDGFSTAVFDEIIKKRHEENKTVIVISCQLPYDAARFTDADAIILSYCSGALREIPEDAGEEVFCVPNLKMALEACFYERDINGKLPVNIPKLDENYKLTDEILFERAKIEFEEK